MKPIGSSEPAPLSVSICDGRHGAWRGLVLILLLAALSGIGHAQAEPGVLAAHGRFEADQSVQQIADRRIGFLPIALDAPLALSAAEGGRHWLRIAPHGESGHWLASGAPAVLTVERVPLQWLRLHWQEAGRWQSQTLVAFGPLAAPAGQASTAHGAADSESAAGPDAPGAVDPYPKPGDPVPDSPPLSAPQNPPPDETGARDGGSDDSVALRFAFDLPVTGGQPVFLEVATLADVSLTPRILAGSEFEREDRRAALRLVAIFTVLAVLAVNAGLLALALRAPSFFRLMLFIVALIALLAALDGLLYRVPVLALFGGTGALGVIALAHGVAAALFCVLRDNLAARTGPTWLGRVVIALPWLFAALAGVALAMPDRLTWLVHRGSVTIWIISGLLALVAATLAARRGPSVARLLLPVWLGLIGIGIARVAWGIGLLPSAAWVVDGFQVAVTASVFLLSIAQTSRVAAFRREHEQVRQVKAQADASLQLEQARRRFSDALALALRASPHGELEWVAFRRLLEALKTQIPQQGAAVVAFGYHELDLMLTEPLAKKPEYAKLLADRLGSLRSLARARTPVQLAIAADGEGVYSAGTYAVAPLPVAKPGWGVVLIEREPGQDFRPEELDAVAEFARVTCIAADEAGASVELKRRAELDPLTGTLNRRALEARLTEAMASAGQRREPLSLLFLDLDHFKQVNDRYGHHVGDDCLCRLVEVVRREVGIEHVFGRYGGEEFVVFLPDVPADRARAIAERIRIAIAQERIEVADPSLRLTVSIGVAARLNDESEPKHLIERADKALYMAKNAGRDRVCVAPGSSFVGRSDAATDHP